MQILRVVVSENHYVWGELKEQDDGDILWRLNCKQKEESKRLKVPVEIKRNLQDHRCARFPPYSPSPKATYEKNYISLGWQKRVFMK